MLEFTLTSVDIVLLLIVGLGAGVVGGMLGIGGSIITIPAMAIIFFGRSWSSQHLFQAAAMISNVFVALPAAHRHKRTGLLTPGLHRLMLPGTILGVIGGVLVSDLLSDRVLKLMFAMFLVWVAGETFAKLIARKAEPDAPDARITMPRASLVGSAMGTISGLLGVGGGTVAVPLAHKLCHLKWSQCIAASAAAMCVTAPIGAILKVSRIEAHGHAWFHPIVIALMLIPTATLGSYLGASLTPRVPVRILRSLFALAVLGAAIRLLWQANTSG